MQKKIQRLFGFEIDWWPFYVFTLLLLLFVATKPVIYCVNEVEIPPKIWKRRTKISPLQTHHRTIVLTYKLIVNVIRSILIVIHFCWEYEKIVLKVCRHLIFFLLNYDKVACVEKRRMGEGEKDLHSDIEQRSKRPVGISATSSQQQPPFEKTHYRFFFLTGGDSAICPLPIFVKSYNQGTWKQSQDVIHRKKIKVKPKFWGLLFLTDLMLMWL